MHYLDIAMTPGEALLKPVADCYVVIDTFRATSVMAMLFHRGLQSLLAVEDIPAARVAHEAHPERLLFGESYGQKPEGFDFGNSPAEAAGLDLAAKDAIHATSNGTRALCAVAERGVAVTGAFVNATAVARFAANYERVLLVCSGNGGAAHFSLEDYATAAVIAQEVLRARPDAELGDGATLATALAAPETLLPRAEHAGVLRNFGFDADLEVAMRRDAAPVVPLVRERGPGWCLLVRG
jgi:2-phosphosulfolactate phosphatase